VVVSDRHVPAHTLVQESYRQVLVRQACRVSRFAASCQPGVRTGFAAALDRRVLEDYSLSLPLQDVPRCLMTAGLLGAFTLAAGLRIRCRAEDCRIAARLMFGGPNKSIWMSKAAAIGPPNHDRAVAIADAVN